MLKSHPFAAPAAAVILCAVLALSGCGKKLQTIIVGSQSVTAQTIAAEIVAQHLEHRLGRKVERRTSLGTEPLVYQELQSRTLSLYPALTGSIEAEILKEPASADPAVVWERSRSELSRLGQLTLLSPLGYDNSPAMVVNAADAQGAKLSTLSQAAAGPIKWKIGVSYEFQQRTDAIPAINSYQLPLAQIIRGMEASELFPALQRGDLNLIAADSIDGHLASSDFRVLTDDRHAFPPNQASLLVRDEVLAAEPKLRDYLSELSGKFTTQTMRKMSAEVDLEHRKPADVAADFLSRAGLK